MYNMHGSTQLPSHCHDCTICLKADVDETRVVSVINALPINSESVRMEFYFLLNPVSASIKLL